MSSLVVDVLATTGKIETADLNNKINGIQKEIANLKNSVKDFIEDNYIDFLPTLKKDHSLMEQASKLIQEMETLKIRIESQIKVELSGSTKELKNLSKALEASNISLNLSSQLLELDDSLKSVEIYEQEKRYVEAAKELKKVQIFLNKPLSDLQLLNIYSPLRDAYSTAYGSFSKTITNLWENQVCWKDVNEADKKEMVSLTVECEKKEIQDIIQALHYVEDLPSCLQLFSNKLIKFMIIPIINYDCSVFVLEKKIFHVKILEKKQTPTYQSVLHNLKLLFQFIDDHLNSDVETESFLGLLGKFLLKPLSAELLKNCIQGIIPSSSSELQSFKPIADDIHELEDYLIEIGFIPDEERFLSDYINDVDKLYVDKICQGLLSTAREIMKKDLHDSFRYEPEKPIHSPQYESENFNSNIERKLSKNTFSFPACQVSKSAKEILELSIKILDEAMLSPESSAARLYYTSRNIFEMYVGTVPEYHKKFLETIPQQVALFHNNCMYFAHHLMTLAYEYRNKIPDHLKKHNLSYVDLTLKLRSVGVEIFLSHMKYQRSIITDILKDSGLSQLGQSPELPASTERALRQCIRQLELLKTVWSDVLPVHVYCKALGCITNSMIENLVTRVITVEDIPAAVATELVTLFNVVVKRAPSIFPEENSIYRFVAKWQKLLELIKILEASLKDIEDRWADGRGPLAHEFTASQVKQLIRALFQNTERRSALLAMIE